MPTDGANGSAVCILVAGGSGERFGQAGGKQMVPVLGEPLLAHSVRAVDRAGTIERIVVVCHPDRVNDYMDAIADNVHPTTPLVAVPGGATRQDSVQAGLGHVRDSDSIVAVHDGARPLVSPAIIDLAVQTLTGEPDLDGLVVGHPLYDTLKRVEGTAVLETPDRARYWVAQTPQVFRAAVLMNAYSRALEAGVVGTDDASIVEAAGGRIAMLEGSRENIKVTTQADLGVAEAVLLRRQGETT